MKIGRKFSDVLTHPVGYILLWIVSFGLILLIGKFLSGNIDSIRQDSLHTLILHISAILSLLPAIVLIVSGYRISHISAYSSRMMLITLIPAIILFILTIIAVRTFPASLPLVVTNGLFLLIISFLLGELLSREVTHPGHLLPVALILVLVDFWSVFRGPSKHVAESARQFAESGGYAQDTAPPLITFLLLNFPQISTDKIYSFMGIGDLIIIAFFIGCIHKFNFPLKRSYASLIIGPVLAVLAANLIGQSIPALPVIAVLFVAVNIGHMKLGKSQKLSPSE
ncbi:MAG: hypothetical protein ABIG42_07595 [bacterium]